MNHSTIEQSAFSSHDKMRSPGSMSAPDRKETVVCPKPLHVGVLNPAIADRDFWTQRWQLSHPQAQLYESKAGSDIIQILLESGDCHPEHVSSQSTPSPPFSSVSPPSRVSNPLIRDARFQDDFRISQQPPLSPVCLSPASSSPPSHTRKGGCVRADFGNHPTVRVEGFDCLDRDRRNCSIPMLA